MQADTIVLGAGIIGVSVAVHLARRGQAVVLVDRRAAGEETSFGNAGLIQREGVMPRAFPQNLFQLAVYGLNRQPDMHFHPTALPRLVPLLFRYWSASRPKAYEQIVHAYAPLIGVSLSEHADLIAAAGAETLVRKHGWYALFRSSALLDKAKREAARLADEFGIGSETLDTAEMRAAEPALTGNFAGAVHWTDPWTVRDPHALVGAYLKLFEKLGGTFAIASADDFTRSANGTGWKIATSDGPLEAENAVIALGPWSEALTRSLGYKFPLAVKRGYHMHYALQSGKELQHSILDAEGGYLIAPMARGIRLTTGAEFARLEARPTPVQLARTEPAARQLFPLGERLDPEPWMGARPITPDMMPIIGPAPHDKNLWFAFGHAHHGLTLGPATGRLIAEMITGETPFIDPQAFSPTRFRP